MSANREAIRDAVATGLGTVLVGDGLPCDEVLNHDGDLSPGSSLRVLSGGSSRSQFGMGSEQYNNRFKLILRWFVPDVATDDSWTKQDVEDRLDLIDKTVADWVLDNIEMDGVYHQLMYDPGYMSAIMPAKPVADTEGSPYMMEETVLIAEVYDGS